MQSHELTRRISSKRCLVCAQEFPVGYEEASCPSDGSLLVSVVEDPFLGLVLDGKYEIQSIIGAGGWSRVYKAKHLDLDQIVAVKVLDAELVGDPLHISHFQNEAKASNALVHPNLVNVLDHGILPQPFIVMEYIEGRTLSQTIDESGCPPITTAMNTFSKVCQAMSYAHSKGFIHRDLTLRNIMLTAGSNDVKVLDFGLVSVSGQKLTQTGETLGSPPYMSPEQCRGERLEPSADVYALGCVMYATLTGKEPFEGQSAVQSMYKHLNYTPPPITAVRSDLEFPGGLAIVVAKALAKDKSDRYQSMDTLLSDLEKIQSGRQGVSILLRRIPSYRQTIKFMARISTVGNVISAALFLLYQAIMLLR
jgi:serine/threonine-protein kinase